MFTIYEDGVQVTDPERIKKLNPVIDVSPAGNSGTIEYLKDGRIKFTPNNANVEPDAEGSMDVTVTCTLKTGAAASHMYTVVISDYKVIAIPQTESIIKTEFFGNQIGASFYITKDGQRLPKSEVDGKCSVTVDKRFKSIELSISTEAGWNNCLHSDGECSYGYRLFRLVDLLGKIPVQTSARNDEYSPFISVGRSGF